MNNRKQLINYLVFIIMIFSLLVYIIFDSIKTNSEIRKAETLINNLINANSLLTTLNDQAIKSEGMKINEINLGEGNEYHSLKSIIGNKSLLILRYTELGCNICVDSIIKNMHIVFENSDTDKIVILTSYTTERDLFFFKKLNNIHYPIYNIKSAKLNLPIEDSEVPFLFITDSILTARSIFIPEKSMSSRTKNYLEIIKRNYFDK